MSCLARPPGYELFIRAQQALGRLCREDGGQDVIEYAFLAAFLATAGMLALNAIGFSILDTYNDWMDPAVGVPSLWEPGTPSGS